MCGGIVPMKLITKQIIAIAVLCAGKASAIPFSEFYALIVGTTSKYLLLLTCPLR